MNKRIALLFVALCLVLGLVVAQPVSREELLSVQDRPIEFINYVGPYSRVDTAADIKGLGSSLGAAVAAGARQSGDRSRYYVIHAVDLAVSQGYDADILVLGSGTGIDHIRNLRRIIAGYLEAAYAYSARDAETLAVFITIYNAVYRSNLDYFTTVYKPVVLKELTKESVGLALRWDEWPGRSRIVIPLGPRAGSGVVGSVATTPISDPATTESVRREADDQNVDVRQDMVDIKEREVAQEEAAIAAERERIAAEEERLQQQAAAASAAADSAAEDTDPAAKPGDSQSGGLTETEAGRQADQEAAAAESQQATASQQQLEADRAAVEDRQAEVDAKKEEIAADREAIAEDQKDQIATQVAAAANDEKNGVVLFELMNPALPLSRLALVDVQSGRYLRRSELNTIRASTAVDVGSAYVAVAGMSTAGGGAVRLIRISKTDYADVVESDQEIFADTMVWYIGSSIYAVTKKDGAWVIGRYATDTLALQSTSDAVSQWTFLTKSGTSLVAQKPRSGFIVMDAVTLKTASEINP